MGGFKAAVFLLVIVFGAGALYLHSAHEEDPAQLHAESVAPPPMPQPEVQTVAIPPQRQDPVHPPSLESKPAQPSAEERARLHQQHATGRQRVTALRVMQRCKAGKETNHVACSRAAAVLRSTKKHP